MTHPPALQLATEIFERMRKEQRPLPYYRERLLAHPKHRLVSHLILGTCRFHPWLERQIQGCCRAPLRGKKTIILSLCMLATYQLFWTQQPQALTVDQALRSAVNLKQGWAKKLINFLLREQCRRFPSQMDDAHPAWLLTRLKEAWPQHWQKIVAANNAQSVPHLRAQGSRAKLSDALNKAGIVHRCHPSVDRAIVLSEGTDITQCPGFESGDFYVQDAGAQMATTLLPIAPGARVLDACAGVGGKTTQLAMHPNVKTLVALDRDAHDLKRLQQNWQRLGLKTPVSIVHADLMAYRPKAHFDAILLDAPCSAIGTIGRHPEIKLRPFHPPDQASLLEKAWSWLAPKGHLLYATCSILPEENEAIIAKFLAHHDADEIKLSVGVARTHGIVILPNEWSDGFYYCLLKKP